MHLYPVLFKAPQGVGGHLPKFRKVKSKSTYCRGRYYRNVWRSVLSFTELVVTNQSTVQILIEWFNSVHFEIN